MKKLYYAGLDVHKDNIEVAILGSRGKEAVSAKRLPNDAMKVVKELSKYEDREKKVQVAYEAGCMGYTLYRTLTEYGFDCRVIPPNKVFHGGEERVKTDHRDALDIAWMLRRDEGESIAIPTAEDEATRDLIRCRGDLQENLKSMKQRLLKFLLRTGMHYETDRYWTGKYYKWLSGLKFAQPLEEKTFVEYMDEIKRLEDKIGRLDKLIEETAGSRHYAQRVKKFRAFRGIDYLTALSLVCEIGDFKRFATAQTFMSYLGLVPSERSSGKKRRQGGITKTGNGHLRRLLTESAWHYARPNQVSKRLAQRRVGTDEQTIRYADKAMKRLHEKYTRMVFKGKTKQTAVTAVARELAGFVWGVMTMAA
jgi:transposase